MDKNYLRQWAQTEEAQPYLQQVGYSQPNYGSYLQELIGANSANPAFQKQLVGYYLDSMDPSKQVDAQQNQFQQQLALMELQNSKQDSDKSMALELLMSGVPEYAAIGKEMLSSILANSGYNAGTQTQPATYEDYLRNNLTTKFDKLQQEGGEISPEEYGFYNYIKGAPKEDLTKYAEDVSLMERLKYAAKQKDSVWDYINPVGNIVSIGDMLNEDAIKRRRFGY